MSRPILFRRRWPQGVAGLAMAVLVATPGAATAQPGATTPRAPSDVLIDQAVVDEVSAVGATDFWVVFDEATKLDGADEIDDWAKRGQYVYDQLTATARASQKLTAELPAFAPADSRHAELRPAEVRPSVEHFWIANTALVRDGDQAILDTMRAAPGVAEIRADQPIELPDPFTGESEDGASTQAVEWGIADIGADRVWDEFGATGDGIVVGSLDTGVEYTHPALVEQYRGNLGDGEFDHDYNWWDPSEICGSPSLSPCDNNNHGTHTTGTMVGDDGGDNRIGVAPRARWIAAKGCESSQCSEAALLSSAQFMLAPTDLAGQDPRPDLRPHVVNSSWGGGYGINDPWFDNVVDAWTAAGIFPVFSNGNGGPRCQTTGSPGHYEGAFGVGAHNSSGNIASFSSRGPGGSDYESVKPNISAPGVAVRSSVRDGGYSSVAGTSMAAPHVSGAVALLWSAAPALAGDIDQTRRILGDTAVDTENLTCGGTPENNNVFGDGRLNAHAAVEMSPRGATGLLTGTVTDAASGDPVAGATVTVAVGDRTRSMSTGTDGTYQLTLSTGGYEASVEAFGYLAGTASGLVIDENETTTEDFGLGAAPRGGISGRVLDDQGDPAAGAIITLAGTPIPPVATDRDGGYAIDGVPVGEYQVQVEGCHEPETLPLVVDGDETLDFGLSPRTDEFGYACQAAEPAWVDAGTELAFDDPDSGLAPVELPFPFPFYGTAYRSAQVSTDGFVSFQEPEAAFANARLPNPAPPNVAVYAFWDDLVVDDTASVRIETLGQAPDRRFVVEWRNVGLAADPTKRVDAEAVLSEDGAVLVQYRDLGDDPQERGGSATIGIENGTGTMATQYSFNQPVLADGMAIRFGTPAWATVAGQVTDANDGEAVAGATVLAIRDGSEMRRAVTDADGSFRLVQAPPGDYTIQAQATNYETTSTTTTVGEEEVVEDLALPTARATVSPDALEVTVASGESTTATIDVANTGAADLDWRLHQGGATERVSVASDGAEANRESGFYHAISADGRYVVFDSLASNLAPGDNLGAIDVFVRDRETGVTERVSVTSDGAEANHSSQRPAISADGRYVVFGSAASNLAPGDTNDVDDVFVHDRETGITERVSVTSDGAEANGGGFEVSISADGRYVAFGDWSTDLVPGDTNGVMDIYVRDRETGVTERVSVASDGTEANGYNDLPRISADGRYVAFTSLATNLVPGDTNGQFDAFVHDRETGVTELVSAASDGTKGTLASYPYGISPDGRYIAFDSDSTNLVPGDTNSRRDSFVRDRETGVTERVSVASDGAQGNHWSFSGQVSADGRYVSFFSNASNLVPGDTNGRNDAFVHDRETGVTERMSVASDGTEHDGVVLASTAMTPDGGTVVFYSDASNLVPGITNGVRDIYVRDRVSWLSPDPASGALAPGESGAIEVTVDATDLEPGVYTADAGLISNSGRQPNLPIAVRIEVTGPACAEPDTRETVIIGDVDSGVPNRVTGDGCTINDLIEDDEPWASHGAFLRHVREVTDQLVADEVINNRERGAIVRAAASSKIGH